MSVVDNMRQWGVSTPTVSPTPDLGFSGLAPAASADPMMPGISSGISPDLGFTTPGGDPMQAPGLVGYGEFPVAQPGDQLGGAQGGQAGVMGPWDKASTILGGIGTIGRIWAGIQANRIARESLDFKRKAWKTNVANQTQSYNTELADRARARYAQMGQPEGADEYIEKNRL